MKIEEAFIKLRDDIKEWVTNNLNAIGKPKASDVEVDTIDGITATNVQSAIDELGEQISEQNENISNINTQISEQNKNLDNMEETINKNSDIFINLSLSETTALAVCKYIRENIDATTMLVRGYRFNAIVNNADFFSGEIYSDGGATYWGTIQQRGGSIESNTIYKYLYVGGADSVAPFKSGAQSESGVVYSSLAYDNSQSHTITFAKPFDKIPTVIAYNNGGIYISVTASNITKTGCTITIKNGSNWQDNINGHWVAFA